MNATEKSYSENSRELDILVEEFKRLNAETIARHAHRYHFHYLVFLIMGVVGAAYVGLGARDQEFTAILLFQPFLFFPIIILMLKEHAYVDLRTSYILNVLRPKMNSLLSTISNGATDFHNTLAWDEFEQAILRKDRTRIFIFGVFAFAEYTLPFLFSVFAIVGVILLNKIWERWEFLIFGMDLLLVFGMPILWVASRWSSPHLPTEYSLRSPH